eukprot:3581333-Lingulodinium_polyedra.AAC.1
MVTALNNLASRSAGLVDPATLRKWTRLPRTSCWIQSHCVEVCLALPRPSLWMRPAAADESMPTSI